MIANRPTEVSDLRILLEATAETCPTGKDRKELIHYAKSLQLVTSIEDVPSSHSPRVRGMVAIVQQIAHDPKLAREFLDSRRKVIDAHESLQRILIYPSIVLLAAGFAFSIFAWSNTMINQALGTTEELAQTLNFRRLPQLMSNSGNLSQGIPILLVSTMTALLLIRLLAGASAWSRVEGSLPWIGKLRRSQSTAELFRNVSLLVRANLDLAAAFELAGRGSSYSINQTLGAGIACDLKRGGTLVEAIASRAWFPNWLVEYFYRVSDRESPQRICYESALLLDVQASSNGMVLVRILPQVLFCGLMVLVQYGYMSMVMRLIQTISILTSF